MSDIPLAREKLQKLKVDLEKALKLKNKTLFDNDIDDIISLLYRESPIRKAEPSSTTITPLIVKKVKRYFKTHPKASQFEVAKLFNINTGRVSEIVNNKRVF